MRITKETATNVHPKKKPTQDSRCKGLKGCT
jgi:hypothetical protein